MADLPDNTGADAGEEENVDQYFDDGGETFLPADHVSCNHSRLLLTVTFSAVDGPPSKRLDEATNGRT